MMDNNNLRLSDRERQEALESLGTHFSEGRLTLPEFDERTTAVINARTRGDLVPLFLDLPTTTPVQPPSFAVKQVSSISTSELSDLGDLQLRLKKVKLNEGIIFSVTMVLFYTFLFLYPVPWFWMVFVAAGVATAINRKVHGLTREEETLMKELEAKHHEDLRQQLNPPLRDRKELDP